MATATSPIIPELPIIRAHGEGEQRATFFELFFDLVYVFAVTQLSHHLLVDLELVGRRRDGVHARGGVLGVELHDVDDQLVRPGHGAGSARAGVRDAREPADGGRDPARIRRARAAVRVRRTRACRSGATRSSSRSRHAVGFSQNFRQILAWSVLSAPLWVAGGIVDSEALRWVLWLGALALDLAAPLVTYWLPGVGATPMSQWQIEGAHFGERFQLFVIIVLGESIVLAGATASDTGLSLEVVAALLLAFLSSTALWWLYFGQVAGRVLEGIRAATAEQRGKIGRDIYTYLHLPIVAGIVLVAVGYELVIAHPTDPLHGSGALVTLGGPALFLAGLMASGARLGHSQSLPRAVVVIALLAAVPLAAGADGLVASGVLTAVLAALVVAEQLRGAS